MYDWLQDFDAKFNCSNLRNTCCPSDSDIRQTHDFDCVNGRTGCIIFPLLSVNVFPQARNIRILFKQ